MANGATTGHKKLKGHIPKAVTSAVLGERKQGSGVVPMDSQRMASGCYVADFELIRGDGRRYRKVLKFGVLK